MSASTLIKDDHIQEQILQAAKQLFMQYGLAKVTMDDVAKVIGKGRSSLYYYYKSKDEIFDAVVKIEIRDMVSAMEKAVSKVESIEEKLNAFFATKLRMVLERGPFFDSIRAGMDAEALTDFHKTKIAHHNLIMQQEGALLTRILHKGIQQGDLKNIGDKEMEGVVLVLLSSLRGIRNEILLTPGTIEIHAIICQFTGLMMNGLKK